MAQVHSSLGADRTVNCNACSCATAGVKSYCMTVKASDYIFSGSIFSGVTTFFQFNILVKKILAGRKAQKSWIRWGFSNLHGSMQ